MQAISLEQASVAKTAVLSLVTFAAIVLLVLVLAYWTWGWLAPLPEPSTPAAQTSERVETAYSLFGSARQENKGGAPTGIAVRLFGVVAAAGTQPAYAVLQLDGKQVLAVRKGADLAPGIRLAEVYAEGVVLERGGVRESLAFPERMPPAPPAAFASSK